MGYIYYKLDKLIGDKEGRFVGLGTWGPEKKEPGRKVIQAPPHPREILFYSHACNN